MQGTTAMDGWQVAIFAFACYFAVRTLIGLMRAHEQKLRRESKRQLVSARKSAANPANNPPAG